MWKKRIKKIVAFFANPRFLLCFFLAWLITNGWSYLLLIAGALFEINWMKAVSSAYIAILWLPISPEKLITIAIAIVLLRALFPRDQKTLAALRAWRDALLEKRKRRKTKKRSE